MNTQFLTFYYDYDDSKYYEQCANRLKDQINSFNGELIIKNPKLTESYNANCLKKPEIILETLLEIKKPLIWIDADCYINLLPIEMDQFIDYDIGFILRNHDYKTPHAALIYFNYNDNTLKFIRHWIDKCRNEFDNALTGVYDAGDHCKLIDSFNELKDISYGFLPPEIASTNIKHSKVIIGISPGGWGVEKRK